MYAFLGRNNGKYLWAYEIWKMKGRGDDKVIDKVTKKFAFEGEVPSISRREYLVLFADDRKATQFAEKWGKKLKHPLIRERVSQRPIDPWFNEVP